MTEYRFRLIVHGSFSEPISDDELLDATDALGQIGCDDCSIGARNRALELEFERMHDSLQGAIVSAIQDVENAGFVVESILMERDAVVPVSSGKGA